MNPQPVSLADELRKLVELWRKLAEACWRMWAVGNHQAETFKRCADELSALLAARAAEQPKLTAPFRAEHLEVLLSGRFGISSVTGAADLAWLADQLNKLRSLLTSPVAPPPPQVTASQGTPPNASPPSWAEPEWVEAPLGYHCVYCDGAHYEKDCPNCCKPVAPGEQPSPQTKEDVK